MVNENSLNIKVNHLYELVGDLTEKVQELSGELNKKADYDEVKENFNNLIDELNNNS